MKGQNYQWYILSVRGGREPKVIEKIKLELENRGLQDRVRQLKVVSDSNQKNILKGYILCRCHLTSELTRFFYQISEVIGFLNLQRGDDKLPGSVSETVVRNFLTKIKEREVESTNYAEVDLKINDLVKITEGKFINQEGRIVQLDKKKQKVKIVIESSGWEISDVPVNACQKLLS